MIVVTEAEWQLVNELSDDIMADILESRGFIVCSKNAEDRLVEYISDDALLNEAAARGLFKMDTRTALDIAEREGYYDPNDPGSKDILWELYDAKLHGDLDNKLHDLFVTYLNTWL